MRLLILSEYIAQSIWTTSSLRSFHLLFLLMLASILRTSFDMFMELHNYVASAVVAAAVGVYHSLKLQLVDKCVSTCLTLLRYSKQTKLLKGGSH